MGLQILERAQFEETKFKNIKQNFAKLWYNHFLPIQAEGVCKMNGQYILFKLGLM